MMFLIFLLQVVLASDEGKGCNISDSQQCYLWDPYASNQEVSRSFSIRRASFATLPTSNKSSSFASLRAYQTPLLSAAPLPNGTPRSMEEYVNLLPISMLCIILKIHSSAKDFASNCSKIFWKTMCHQKGSSIFGQIHHRDNKRFFQAR